MSDHTQDGDNGMIDDLNDAQIIARLRLALDEVVAGSAVTPLTLTTVSPRHHPARVLSLAAAVVSLVVATGWILAVRGPGTQDAIPLNTSATVDTSSVVTPTTVLPTTSIAANPVSEPEWYSLNLPDFTPEPIVKYCSDGPPAYARGSIDLTPTIDMAWAAKSGYADGILVLSARANQGAAPLKGVPIDVQDVLTFESYGLSDARVTELKSRIVTGSGVPYVLDDPAMELVGLDVGDGSVPPFCPPPNAVQTYTNALGRVRISLSPGEVGQFLGLAITLVRSGGFDTVEIAGHTGYRFTFAVCRCPFVTWQMPSGDWGQLQIPQVLADRADEIIAAVATAPYAIVKAAPGYPAGTNADNHQTPASP